MIFSFYLIPRERGLGKEGLGKEELGKEELGKEELGKEEGKRNRVIDSAGELVFERRVSNIKATHQGSLLDFCATPIAFAGSGAEQENVTDLKGGFRSV